MKIVDVRTSEEYNTGHIDGAILHTLQDIIQGNFPEIAKDEEIILYCASGNRSMMAKTFLEKAGFTKVTNGGGMQEVAENLRLGLSKSL